jgi:hypothetical protein
MDSSKKKAIDVKVFPTGKEIHNSEQLTISPRKQGDYALAALVFFALVAVAFFLGAVVFFLGAAAFFLGADFCENNV